MEKTDRKRIEVVAAVIVRDFTTALGNVEHQIFATQRGYGEWKDWWEFPGGKIENGESPEDALRREIREEFGSVKWLPADEAVISEIVTR